MLELENVRHSLENGFYYDFEFSKPISDDDLPKIEEKMREILPNWNEFEGREVDVKMAKSLFKGNPYKEELIDEIKSKGEKLTIYQSGDYEDLCRGGHVKNAKDINPDAFKLTHIAGAYWRGDEKNKMLTRIYGIAFNSKEELDKYLWQQEEAKKRDHRKLGQELDLFTFSDLVGPGLPLWTVKGTIIREELEKFAKETEEKWGYKRITTPHIAKAKLFETSGHLPYYQNDMYPGMELDDATYYLKAMNCPMTMAMFGQKPHSYREFPVRLAEYGTVYRHELSGVLTGLLRVRGFTQNDAHIFCREDQLEDEFIKVMQLHEYYYGEVFGIKDYYIRLSLRDKTKKDKFGGEDTLWEKAESIIRSAIKKSGVPFQEAVGEASFYGPKADFQIKSVVGREETASTNQIDFIMPARFGLTYVGEDGNDHPVAVIHRAPLGSHERFIGFLIEHYAGAFPLWLSPVQVAVLPITDEQNGYAEKVSEEFQNKGIRVEKYFENETIGKKIRTAELQKITYILVVGGKEEQNETINVRHYRRGQEGETSLDELVKKILDEVEKKII